MSINKTTHSPLALREGFHVVLLRALAERLQGRDWVLKGGTNLRLYFGYPIQRRHRSRRGQGRCGRHATRHSGDAGGRRCATASASPRHTPVLADRRTIE